MSIYTDEQLIILEKEELRLAETAPEMLAALKYILSISDDKRIIDECLRAIGLAERKFQ